MRECWGRAWEKFAQDSVSYGPWRYQLTNVQAEQAVARCSRKPLITLVLLMEPADAARARNCILSVMRQQYPNWELLLTGGRTSAGLQRSWVAWRRRDGRVREIDLDPCASPASTRNAAIKSAHGEFVGFVNARDELAPDALTWMVWAINESPSALWLYSDEDEVSASGKYGAPHYKSDFSPYMLLASRYTGNLSLYRTSLLAEAAGFREGFEGAEDHDLTLRLSERVKADQVAHIPRVLYHHRALPEMPSASSAHCSQGAGIRAVQEALRRRSLRGTVAPNPSLGGLYSIRLQPATCPKVSVIIATHNALPLLKNCVNSLREKTRYPNYEVFVIDNRSDDPELIQYLREESTRGRLRPVVYERPFNHSDMHNRVIAATDAEYVVLINNDVEVSSDGWLEQMLAIAEADPTVAGVGALLRFPDGRVQHGGVVLGLHGVCGHAHRLAGRDEAGYFGRLRMLQELSAVTGALVLLRRSAFMSVGAFNAERYPTSLNDIDLWLRLRRAGWRCVYDPAVQAIHHETATRQVDIAVEREFERRLKSDWGDVLQNDPFYNPNLARDNEQFIGLREFPVESQMPFLRSS